MKSKPKKRTRVSKAEIVKHRQAILEGNHKKAKPRATPVKKSGDYWYGILYCDHAGNVIIGSTTSAASMLGKTDQLIPFLKERNIDCENPTAIKAAVRLFHNAEKTNGH